MERVQGLHRTTDGDGLGVRSSPIQHDFFPYKNLERKASRSHSDGETSTLPVPHTIVHPSGSADWPDSWKWDGFRLRAEPVVNTQYSDGSGTHQDVQFPHNTGTNAVSDDQTSLELGLMNNSPENNSNDDLLALTLGGTDYGLDDQIAPNAKKSRHSPPEMQHPRCQVDDCNANLQYAKDYHRRHKVCEVHSKSSKAFVSQVLQRFCQQCSRFHLLEEFDGDRRSCRRRLAGHNRRRRRGQPDAAAALASVLGDPDALSRLINPLQQLQGKEQLEQLVQILGQTLKNTPARQDAPTTSLNQRSLNDVLNAIRTGTQIPEASSSAVGGASSDDLNTVLKSQILRNLFLSNSTIANNLLAMASAAPANVQISHISALYDALLSPALALQPKTDENFCHQRGDSSLNVREQSERHFNMSDAHVTVAHRSNIPSKEFNVSNDNLNDIIHFGSNSLHVSSSEHIKVGKDVQNRKQGLTAIHDEHFKAERAVEAWKGTCTNGDASSTNTFLTAEKFAGGLEKQEQTFQLWFKMFDKSPADLPPTLREQMLEWLHHLPTEMEGYIRPGCVILTVFVCMPVYAWEELCNNIEENLYRLLSCQEGHFWCKGQTLVHFGEASAFILEGKVFLNNSRRLVNSPWLILVQPFAVVVGEKVDLILKGHNLEEPGTKFICAYEGNCIEKELDLRTEEDEECGLHHVIPGKQENSITFHLGPFDNMGHSFIEVEGRNTKGNVFPIIIADKALCKEILSLEAEFTNILENRTSSGLQRKEQSDIVHFIYELGWLLHRIEWNALYTESRTQQFSPGKYRWLLQFSVKHGFCIVVKRILDFIFSQDNDAWNNTYERAYEMLSEISLLHLAVSSKSRAMVESLLEYIPPRASDFKQRHIFRPDVRSHSGLTPLHIAASLRGASSLMDALTNAPKESWVEAWLSSKDSLDQTPLMYALATGNHECIQLVQKKIDQSDLKPSYLSLDIDSSLQKISTLRKQMRHCSCQEREVMLGPNFSLKAQRPFVLSMLAIAAMCVCVGLLMKGPPTISFIQGPFVWKFIKFGPI